MVQTNPNGANQYLNDPRQLLFWDFYLTPKSKTFSNAFQSAIKAKYRISTATQITTEKWFLDKLRRMNLLSKAEKVLEETLGVDHIVKTIGMFGPIKDRQTGKDLKEINPKILKVKQDTAKFVAERLGKKKGYSMRTEITGPEGKELPTPILNLNEISRNNSNKKDTETDKKN